MLAPPLSTLANNVQIYGEDAESAPPLFIIKTLITDGAVAYYRPVGEWFAFSRVGRLMRDGMPSSVSLIGNYGARTAEINFEGKDGDLCIIPANAFFTPPLFEVMRKVGALEFISAALTQNVDALKQASAIIYDDPELATQIDAAERGRLEGKSTVKIQRSIGQEVEITPFSPAAESHIAEFLAVWTQTLEELDETTGRVKVGEKTERRTDDEINVIENSACSSIDVIIDTFNRYAQWYGLNARAERGTEIRREKVKEAEGEAVEAQEETDYE